MISDFGFLPLASPLLNEELFTDIVAPFAGALAGIGGQKWSESDITEKLPLLFFVATGGTEKSVLEIRSRRSEVAPKEPVILLAHPGNNSLPASLEVLARLGQDGIGGRIVFMKTAADQDALEEIAEIAGSLDAQRSLQDARIGLIGGPSEWLVASSPDRSVVRDVWGPEVIRIDMSQLYRMIDDVPASDVAKTTEHLISHADSTVEPSEQDVVAVVRVYHALARMIESERLAAIAVRCFDLVVEKKTTGCFALSELADAGLVAACEGDIPSAVAMLWSSVLLDEVSWMANPASVDLSTNTIVLAHCTVPRKLVGRFTLRSHFESGCGVGLQGEFPAGPVTLLRIGGAKMEKLWIGEGEIVGTGCDDNLCRTQLKIRLESDKALKELIHQPLGNHLVVVPGRHAGCLTQWWELIVANHLSSDKAGGVTDDLKRSE